MIIIATKYSEETRSRAYVELLKTYHDEICGTDGTGH